MFAGQEESRVLCFNLPETFLAMTFERLKFEQIIERIWKHDHTVWNENPEEISNRLGWLQSHTVMKKRLGEINNLVNQVRADGYNQALLLGMGGSSLAPEVFRKIFSLSDGFLDLDILDSTDPGAVIEQEKKLDLHKTLVIVSTKSGGTVETASLMKYFYNKMASALGSEQTGKHFIAITDPGSSLEKTALELNFRATFLNDPAIGGRYSALSYFGLVPAALIGVNLETLLDSASGMALSAKTGGSPMETGNSAALLGVALGTLGSKGRNKVTLISSPPIESFGTWIEQLIAESTGKEGKGLLPVVSESLSSPEIYASDRFFIYLHLDGDAVGEQGVKRLIDAEQPLIQFNLADQYALGGELFRWMFATAIAGWVMGINPFDQPNVESAKILAREMVMAYQEKGELPALQPDLRVDGGIEVYSGQTAENLQQVWDDFLKEADFGINNIKNRSYIAIHAYLKPDPATDRALQRLRDQIRAASGLAVTVGYGPRFLHSTGQLHKGDAGKGLFVQLTAPIKTDLPIPDQPGSSQSSISFGLLKTAQALGDRQALLDAGRKVIRFELTADPEKSIDKLTAEITVKP
jgi:glucose-6-phosphate isomerase